MAAEASPSKKPRTEGLPMDGEFKDDLHVNAAEITEALLDDWVVDGAKPVKDAYFSGIGRFKDKYKIRFLSGGIINSEFQKGKFTDNLEVCIQDPAERAGMEVFNAWVRKRFLKRDSFDAKLKPSEEQMKDGHEALMASDGTLKLKSDRKNPAVFARYRHEGPMSSEDVEHLSGKPWDKVVLEVRGFYADSASSSVSSRLVFLRADPDALAGAPVSKVSVNYDN